MTISKAERSPKNDRPVQVVPVGNLLVQLIGGPMDGDQIALCANGSVRPPQQLCYMATSCGQAVWLVYESRMRDADWPMQDVARKFDFVGKEPVRMPVNKENCHE
jgi:hypothetical protein